jgi:hypothetical protein
MGARLLVIYFIRLELRLFWSSFIMFLRRRRLDIRRPLTGDPRPNICMIRTIGEFETRNNVSRSLPL